MVVVDLGRNRIDGDYKPSSDAYTHMYIHKNFQGLGGIVDANSRYATAFAAVGKEILCVPTAMGDEFGGPIPCGGFALIGDGAIGKVVVESIGKSPAVLLKNHGVFAIGKNATAAVEAAIMTEEVAATVWMAMQIGTPDVIPQEDMEKLHYRYNHLYGNYPGVMVHPSFINIRRHNHD